jgi:hypothetical protein
MVRITRSDNWIDTHKLGLQNNNLTANIPPHNAKFLGLWGDDATCLFAKGFKGLWD